MTPPLREKFETIRALFASATRDDVRARYRIGVQIREIKESETKYGQRAIAALALALHRDDATLYRHGLVAERWTEEEIEALLARRTDRGEPLTWTHLIALANVADDARRTALTAMAIERDLSVRELIALCRREGPRGLLSTPGSVSARSVRRAAQIVGLLKRKAREAGCLLRALDATTTPEAISLLEEVAELQLEPEPLFALGTSRLKSLRAQPEVAASPHPARPAAKVPSLRTEKRAYPRLLWGGA